MTFLRSTWRARMGTLLLGLAALLPAHAQVDDTFDGSSLDSCRWEPLTQGGSVSQGGELLLATEPAPSFGSSRVLSQYRLIGDFDVQVDYRRVSGFDVTLPPASPNVYDQLNLAIGLHWNEARYIQFSRARTSGGEVVSVYSSLPSHAGVNAPSAEASGATGALRLVRTGTRLSFRHLSGGSWTEVGQLTVPDTPVSVYLGAVTVVGGGRAGPPIRVAFDNFRLNAGATDQKQAQPLAPYARRSDFAAGGTMENWTSWRYQSTTPIDPNLLGRFRAEGMAWLRVGVTTVSKPALDATPLERWVTLPSDPTTWSTREAAARSLLDAQAAGMRLYAYLYFSDQAANWGNQKAPDAWAGKSVAETAALMEQHAFDIATYFKGRGLNVEIYEIGNETDIGITGFVAGGRIPIPPGVDHVNDHDWLRENVWKVQAELFKAAARGIRRAAPGARIALHAAGVEVGVGTGFAPAFYAAMRDFGVDHDIAALSHPYATHPWKLHHYSAACWFKRLGQIVDRVASPGRPAMFVEASYQSDPRLVVAQPMPDFPFTPQGQSDWLAAQLGFASRHPALAGWFYFYPEFYPGIVPVYEELQGGGLMAGPTTPQPGLARYRVNLDNSTEPIEPQAGVWAIDAELNGQAGRGFQLDARKGTLVLSFYGYETSGRARFWLAVGPIVQNGFSAPLVTYDSGTPFGGSYRAAQLTGTAGTVQVRFTSAVEGTITLPGEAPQRISRLRYGSGGTGNAITPVRGVWAIDAENTGQAGRGFQLDHQGGTLVLSFYGYTAEGNSRFWLATGALADNRFSGTLESFDGGAAFGSAWKPAQRGPVAGAVSLVFTGERTGVLTLPGEPPRAVSLVAF
ncbi:glycosyl hydrolase 53 family protein [Ramlibacter sp.]|uniref:glycosyl hydrolase 53 family protein n=1 Tax=Ramlibacter sp. TaxID=1917967 RepID=UPI0035B1AB84